MTEREKFESHYGVPVEQRRAPSAGGYARRDFQLMWAAWQASRRAALEEAIRATVQAKTTSHACDAIRALADGGTK